LAGGEERPSITKGEKMVAATLVAGTLISIMITIVGVLLFVVQQFLNLSLAKFLLLPMGLQIAVVGGGLLAIFLLAALFCIVWNRGYKLLLKWIYEVTAFEED